MASVTFFRQSAFADCLRAYDIRIDGLPVGEIWNGGIEHFTIASGEHTVQLHMDWCRSRPVRFVVRDDETVFFNASSRLQGLNLLFVLPAILLMPFAYLRLSQLSDDARPVTQRLRPWAFILGVGFSWGFLSFGLAMLWSIFYRHETMEPKLVLIKFMSWMIVAPLFGAMAWWTFGRRDAQRVGAGQSIKVR